MSARLTNLDFEAGDAFEVYPKLERSFLEGQFAALKDHLLSGLFSETDTLTLIPRFERAANEAAAVAWTTDFPLLVFPTLLEEFARRERNRENRQSQIRAKSEKLMECSL